jgi:protein-tyrosine phosphatase
LSADPQSKQIQLTSLCSLLKLGQAEFKMPELAGVGDISKAAAMLDHFEKIQKLPDKVDGVPNFRRVPGYKVFCCGQPTKEGFVKAIEKACGDKWPKDGPIIWLNMRQEAIVYVNGNPVCARPANKIGEYAELGNVTRASVKAEEAEFIKVLQKRAEDGGGKIKVIDVAKKESEVEVKELITLHDVIEEVKKTFPGLTHNRIPVCNSAAPLEADFDTLCSAMIGTNVNCPVIVNCQVGLSRSTTGCVSACLFREFQLSASYEGLIETVPGVNLELLRMDNYELEKDKDALFRGEFEVVKELVAALGGDGNAAKRECDKVIDKNGPPPKGTGIKQLRENIAESKLSYEIMDDAAQAFLKTKIMDNIQKYFYLICFTAYLREQSKVAKDGISDEEKKAFALTGGKVSTPTESLKLGKNFVAWMEEHANLRTLCDEGKGKLQWERDIPQDALDNLQNLANTDFKKNLGKIIHDIYLTGHNLFKDMPQGDHKKRAKYRFASKTLMRILPDNLKTEVETLINQKSMTLDLYEILGQCTWGQGKSL